MPSVTTEMARKKRDESSRKLRFLTFDALDMRTAAAKRALKARDALIAQATRGGHRALSPLN